MWSRKLEDRKRVTFRGWQRARRADRSKDSQTETDKDAQMPAGKQATFTDRQRSRLLKNDAHGITRPLCAVALDAE